jgi:hypothetical protein
MLKVTIKFAGFLFFYCLLGPGCGHPNDNDNDKDAALHRADSISEAKIDSAYKAIADSCDTLIVHRVPQFADSVMKGDTVYMDKFFAGETLFMDSNKKVERIVRQLQADCDSGLRKEVFKKVQLLQRSKRAGKGIRRERR